MRTPLLGAFLALALPCAACSSSDEAPPAADRPATGTVELFAELPTSTEGIAIGKDASGQIALFAAGGDTVYHIAADGTVSDLAEVPKPVGLAYHPDGYLLVCGETDTGSGTGERTGAVWRVSLDGTAEVVLGAQAGQLQLDHARAELEAGAVGWHGHA